MSAWPDASSSRGATIGTNKRYPSREPDRTLQPPRPQPSTSWHPSQIAKPVEWELHNGWPPTPLAVIRKLQRQRGNQNETFYRAVTWAPESSARELVGYYATGDEAAAAAWEHFHGRHDLCRHEQKNANLGPETPGRTNRPGSI